MPQDGTKHRKFAAIMFTDMIAVGLSSTTALRGSAEHEQFH